MNSDVLSEFKNSSAKSAGIFQGGVDSYATYLYNRHSFICCGLSSILSLV